MSQPETSSYVEQVLNAMRKQGYEIISDLASLTSSCSQVQYRCYPCQVIKTKTLKDINRRIGQCKQCSSLKVHVKPVDTTILRQTITSFNVEQQPDEIWMPVVGGYVSNKGKVVSGLGGLLKADERNRFYVNGRLQSIESLMQEAEASGEVFCISTTSTCVKPVSKVVSTKQAADRYQVAVYERASDGTNGQLVGVFSSCRQAAKQCKNNAETVRRACKEGKQPVRSSYNFYKVI